LAEVLTVLCAAEKTDKTHKTINTLSKHSRRSALHAAAFNGHLQAVTTLMNNGADPELQVNVLTDNICYLMTAHCQ
jgi:ankyrin repeat protein